MSLLIALNRLEAHLQTLVEGSLARLFPAPNLRHEIAQRLVMALRQEARHSPDGQVLAPDRYTVFLPDAQAAALSRRIDLLAELAQDLSLAAATAGVGFVAPPTVRVLPDRGATGLISVLAQYTLTDTGSETQGTAGLLAPTLPAAPHNAFLLLDNGKIFPLEAAVTNLGSSPENQVYLPDTRLAPLHAQIRLTQGRCTLFNLAPPGSTLVNDLPVSQHELKAGDVISLDSVRLIFGLDYTAGSPDDTQPFP